jgi:hypothetical protein
MQRVEVKESYGSRMAGMGGAGVDLQAANGGSS